MFKTESPYLPFRKWSKVRCAYLALRDRCLRPILGKTDAKEAPRQADCLCIAKIDQLGDLLMITPILHALRAAKHYKQRCLVTGAWNAQLAELLLQEGIVDRIEYYNAVGCNKCGDLLGKVGLHLKSAFHIYRVFKAKPPDIWIDLRQRSPNTVLLARLVGAKWRLAFAGRGLEFTLHQALPWDNNLPLGDNYVQVLECLGIEAAPYGGPILPQALRPSLAPSTGYWLVHPFSREVDREITDADCERVLKELKKSRVVVLVGTKADCERRPHLIAAFQAHGAINLVGKNSVTELFQWAANASGVVCADSFVAHVALAYKRSTVVIMGPGSVRESFPGICPRFRFVPSGDEKSIAAAVAQFDRSTETQQQCEAIAGKRAKEQVSNLA